MKKEKRETPEIPEEIKKRLLAADDYYNEGWISKKEYQAIRKECNLNMRIHILKSKKKP